ncbi:TetR/AcrR family transcriptional regulator [Streptomyces rimosus subsp. rimosus ATCC 10970]|uniref:TetR/AcrR family transcriptional regulator n=1 Tax=Streptomyces rimosus subsp. rimosus (strain ATCC 10970 / DSM 40260 / JCM 4667 / NRRL 2234) TaxID=1265868 RepID=A0A8A1UZX4_STRR1|nr:TetR family transcriptional regulator [Streptomyces sp. SID5471]QST86153.1 TetR/AcrR family transcriptional regulator [Streptomyces rimosus subsp. rimosus ATCC 10970]
MKVNTVDEATRADADGARSVASEGTGGKADGGGADAHTGEAAHQDATAPRATGPARERTSQGSRTRTLILETALRLFQERGYDKTTMRAIAQEAGVSVGNAYYYYASKEHLIQGFYDRIAAEHAAAVTDVLARERDLAGRLRGVLLTWLDIAAPYHRFAAQFFKNAADPDSPLSPFSDASEGPREAAIALHRQVLAGADTKADPELAAALPRLLWLQQMGLVLYWVYDRSENCERSRRLVERTSPLVARAVAASRFRVLRPLVREVTDVLSEFVLPAAAGAAARPRSDQG